MHIIDKVMRVFRPKIKREEPQTIYNPTRKSESTNRETVHQSYIDRDECIRKEFRL